MQFLAWVTSGGFWVAGWEPRGGFLIVVWEFILTGKSDICHPILNHVQFSINDDEVRDESLCAASVSRS